MPEEFHGNSNILASLPHDMLNQLQQWLEFCSRLDDDNTHLKRQILELQARKDRLMAYENTCEEMVATQNQLIVSLSARIATSERPPKLIPDPVKDSEIPIISLDEITPESNILPTTNDANSLTLHSTFA
ncbi:hypothetical protein FOVG_19234 [Fusarium oxysporum f. sp. pisi HDV247]|uniref:Uncharacterized protein n=1 Tax=Fusarium oxysporum f. sp. pisi HDV247 TaxID=1080344 RepID=W9NN04_FUSOX|nr:hypothetical protein FOVG_19234 [Fusarium oxysporum f. sp. pisi HDV247]